MAGVRALFDTNILIDYLNGRDDARIEIDRYDDCAISLISWMEVLTGVTNAPDDKRTRGFLDIFTLLGVDREVSERAIAIRRTKRLRLPDAIIWATAQVSGALLVTRNTRDFPAGDPGVRIPYGA